MTVSTEEEDAVGIGREAGSETEGGREAGTTIDGQEAGTATVGGRRQTTATDAGVGHGRAVEVAARAGPGPEIETMEVARGDLSKNSNIFWTSFKNGKVLQRRSFNWSSGIGNL